MAIKLHAAPSNLAALASLELWAPHFYCHEISWDTFVDLVAI